MTVFQGSESALSAAAGCKILYVIGQLRAGGSERQLYYLLRDMDRHAYRPAVVVWNFQEGDTYVGKIRELDVPIFEFPDDVGAAWKLLRLRRLVAKLGPEIVHSFSFYLNFAADRSVRGTTAVAVGSMRGALELEKSVTGWLLGRISGRWPRTQIYNSWKAATTARDSKSLFVPRFVSVVSNGVDLELFSPKAASVPVRGRVLAVGSLFSVKRWDRLLRAARELKTRNVDFSIEIIGDGPLRGSLEAEARRLGIFDRVVFRGHSDDVAGRLSEASFLVHSSDAEGCPNAILEAMACARAVVTTDVGDARVLVEDGRTGFVVSSGNDASLVQRMLTLLTDCTLSRRMGEAARARAEGQFGVGRMVSDTLAVYRTTAGEGKKANRDLRERVWDRAAK